jgi:LemA protein
MKNKGCLSAGTIGIALLLIVATVMFWGFRAYKELVSGNNEVQKSWSNVEMVFQKRTNLIPALENTVKSYSKFEQKSLSQVIDARSKATAINIDPSKMTEQDLAKFQAAQGELTLALSRLNLDVKKYPELKSDQQFLNFQRENTAIEISIRTEKQHFNDATQDYNTILKTFPNNILACFINFLEKPYFKAAQ